ncbi:helix-turn-helix transcriptional regulator [Cupriavidus necator]|uniref:AraC family transcriptional regulator n=1 Tax=Cupriavidus necator TaxID=106590 RepID=A0A367PM11_CUPNE|nr:helix-turn-helix transcriptional regulator [Cupriavidus necator]RCJ08949.1 AraC family transcriptional regulator [Cupriavidus necator]
MAPGNSIVNLVLQQLFANRKVGAVRDLWAARCRDARVVFSTSLCSEGWRLAQMVTSDSHSLRIARAINWLQAHYSEPLAIEDLAREVHMSVSSLHAHFIAVTAMSPLQFQKQLRLQEARRIMLTEKVDAGIAGHRVGYESQSQFSREYSRFFGAPPVRDIKRLCEESSQRWGAL